MALDYRGTFFFPNRIEGATLSDGAWVEALSLDSLKERLLARVARTIDLDPANARFTVDFGRPLSIGVVALIAHNISLTGRILIEASNNADMSSPQISVAVDAWPALVGAKWDRHNVTWQSRNFWRGTYAPEDVAGQTAKSVYVLDQPVVARYWRVIIFDQSNLKGFIDIGRAFLGESFLQPRINYSYGASTGYETDTIVEKSLGGAEFFDPRESIMVQRFQFDALSDEEGFSRALELTRRAGVHREIIFVPDPSDKRYGAQRVLYGRLRALNPLEQAMFQLNSMSFELKELR